MQDGRGGPAKLPQFSQSAAALRFLQQGLQQQSLSAVSQAATMVSPSPAQAHAPPRTCAQAPCKRPLLSNSLWLECLCGSFILRLYPSQDISHYAITRRDCEGFPICTIDCEPLRHSPTAPDVVVRLQFAEMS